MSKRWSKLQREFYQLRAEGLDLQLHCRVYRMGSQRGSTDCPRYWITLGKEVIWDYPRDFSESEKAKRLTDEGHYPYITDVSDISALIRDYIDTPKGELLSRSFDQDRWGLVDLLRASDRRVGLRRLAKFKQSTTSKAAHRLMEARLA
ncbi:SF0329 family protein [Dongshaea marina]|uniref:SF0329 family protein n=1 Tax=Dongshaea marina TaxID=2047966 RepID=UPI000D3E9EF8|nr:hypothetical protein [Dongshaea marina]